MWYCRHCHTQHSKSEIRPYCPQCGKINPYFVTRPMLEKRAIKKCIEQMDKINNAPVAKRNCNRLLICKDEGSNPSGRTNYALAFVAFMVVLLWLYFIVELLQ